MIASVLFTWIQGADFYHDLHKQAVDLLPNGGGKTWMDIGCGPGLVSRLAAKRGYQVIGIDSDPQMIRAAKRIAKWQDVNVNFQMGDVFNLPTDPSDIVSAASLLAVLGDRPKGLHSLWSRVKPNGALLVIEPTDQMTTANAYKAIANGLPRKRINGLRMWASARQGNIVNPVLYESLGAGKIEFTPLLHGLVGAWIIRK